MKNIFISSVLQRRKHYTRSRCDLLNSILRELCGEYGFVFIDNTNITLNHLDSDGIHLTQEGSIVLANNYLEHLNSNYWDDVIARCP